MWGHDLTSLLYTIALLSLACPEVLSLVGDFFREMGVVHQITYIYGYFLFLLTDLFIHFYLI